MTIKTRMDRKKRVGYVKQSDIDEARYFELIRKMAEKNDFISRADVMELLHISPSKAYTLLKALVGQGVLVAINKGRYAKYAIKKKN